MYNENNDLVEMLNSKNKDNVYLAVTMIRNSYELSNYKKLLSNISLFDKIKNYSDVCKELNVKELIENDFNFLPKEQRLKVLSYHKIQNIIKLFNENWILNWNDSNQKKYYPWFEKKASGWGFSGSFGRCSFSYAVVGCYKSEEVSNFVGKLFKDLYINIIE